MEGSIVIFLILEEEAWVVAFDRALISLLLLVVMFTPTGEAQADQNKDKTTNQSQSEKNPASQFDWNMTTQIPLLLSKDKLIAEQIPNPHWRDDACLACHSKDGKQASSKNIRSLKNAAVCLNCHDARFDHSYIHPVDIKPDANMQTNISKLFKQSLQKTGGKISCVTCHDLTMQCLPEKKKMRGQNPKFFRGGPFETRSEQCFYCHDDNQYPRLNPHDQIDEQGKLKENTCRVCHSGSIESLKQAKSIDKVKFNLTNNLEKMCWGCHPWTPHPGGQFSFFSSKKGPDHLVKPSKFVQDTLDKMSVKHNIDLPLEPGTGRVFCGTCHNPHEKNVIKNKQAAKGADSKKRLRVQKICQYCHYK